MKIPYPLNGNNCCAWALGDKLYEAYHHAEWGVPLHDDNKHFEFLLLECMQAGLSWITILKKRENFREAFAGFDPEKVALFSDSDIDRLMLNKGIIRYRKKLEAAVNNARRFLEIRDEFGSFDKYIWSFTQGTVVKNRWKTLEEIPVTTTLSDIVSRDLKKRGFKFVGSTTIYAHLQAIGIVNDHLVHCYRYNCAE